MSIDRQMEKDEQCLSDQLSHGEIDDAEYNKEMKALRREHRESAGEAAQEAYDEEYSRWW